MKYTEYNEDYGRAEFAHNIERECGKYSALQSLISGKELEKEDVKNLREFKVVQQFLDSPVGSPLEAKLKKVFAASSIVANEQGSLPFKLKDKSPVAIASAVDEGLNRVKLSYKVSTGEKDVTDAVDVMIDATVARAATVTDKVIERGVPIVLDKLSEVVTKIYPPAAVFTPYIKAAEKVIVPVAKVAVRKGLSFIGETAKTVVHSAVKTAKKVGRKILSWLGV